MDVYFPPEGNIPENDFPSILFQIHKHSISGILTITTEEFEKKLKIRNQRILFCQSNLQTDSLGQFLKREKRLTADDLESANQLMERRNCRLGRALLELRLLNSDSLWQSIQDHLKMIVFSLLRVVKGSYRIEMDREETHENITLDIDILSLLLAGLRQLDAKEYITKKLKGIPRLYWQPSDIISQLQLKPYELHVLDLVKHISNIKKIKNQCELLPAQTEQILYMFLCFEILSTTPRPEREKSDASKEDVTTSTFRSFEEAIGHYNLKYEYIFKLLSKEIGPVSLSILSKGVEEIVDDLPPYMQKIQFNGDGTINEDLVLKSLWYNDFEKSVGEFLRALEEILYTEIFVARKHLGIESEKQILQWLKEIGN